MLSISKAGTEPSCSYFTAPIEPQPPKPRTVNIKHVWCLWSRVGLPPVITSCRLFTVRNEACRLLGQSFTHIFVLRYFFYRCKPIKKISDGWLSNVRWFSRFIVRASVTSRVCGIVTAKARCVVSYLSGVCVRRVILLKSSSCGFPRFKKKKLFWIISLKGCPHQERSRSWCGRTKHRVAKLTTLHTDD